MADEPKTNTTGSSQAVSGNSSQDPQKIVDEMLGETVPRPVETAKSDEAAKPIEPAGEMPKTMEDAPSTPPIDEQKTKEGVVPTELLGGEREATPSETVTTSTPPTTNAGTKPATPPEAAVKPAGVGASPTPGIEEMPLAFGGGTPLTTPVASDTKAEPTPVIAPPTMGVMPQSVTNEPPLPVGVQKAPEKPKGKKKGKVLFVILGLFALLGSMAGGGYWYFMNNADPLTIMLYSPDALIRQRERTGMCKGAACLAPELGNLKKKADDGDANAQSYLNSLTDDRAGSVGANTLAIVEMNEIAKGEKRVGSLGSNEGTVTTGIGNALDYCQSHGGSNCSTVEGMSSFLKTFNVTLYNEYQRTLSAQGLSSQSDLPAVDVAINNLCNDGNSGKIVSINDWPEGFDVGDNRVTAIDCRVTQTGKFVGIAYYDFAGLQVTSRMNDPNGCAGLTRTSAGESHNGGFVGCNGTQNCFCSGDVAVGDTYTGGAITCVADYANDSCALTPPTGTVYITEPPDEPPDEPPGETPPPTTPVLACTSLSKNVIAPKIGDAVTFTCAGSVTPAGATTLTYAFRYRIDAGAWTSLTPSATTASLTIASAGAYDVECQACGTIENASVCDPTWTGATP